MSSPKVLTHQDGKIAPSYAGFYCEFAICNHTTENVVYFDRWGKRVVIKPSNTYARSNTGVHIFRRNVNGERMDSNNNRIPIPMTETIIHPTLYGVDGYYLVEEQVLICNESRESVLQHPSLVDNYDTVHKDTVKAAVNGSPTITITANDPHPTKPLSNIYCNVYGATIPVKCANYPGTTAEFKITISSGDKLFELVSEDFTELRSKGTMSVNCNGELIVIGLTHIGVQDVYDDINRNKVTYKREDINNIIKNSIQETEVKMKLEIDTLKADIVKKDIELVELSNKLSDATIRGDMVLGVKKVDAELGKIHSDNNKQETMRETLEYKRDEQTQKSHRAALSTGGEAVKVFGTVAKIAAGVCVGLITAAVLPAISGAGAAIASLFAFI